MTNTVNTVTDERYQTLARRIRALLELAKDPGATPAEAALATAKATALLTKYNLDLARIQAQPKADDYVNRTLTLLISKGPYVKGHRLLLHNLARFNFCRSLHVTRTPRVYLVGAAHNVETVISLYQLLAPEIRRMAESAWPTSSSKLDAEWAGRSIAHAKITYLASYFEGACITIQQRLDQQRREATTPVQRHNNDDSDGESGHARIEEKSEAEAEAGETRALIVLTEQRLNEAVNRLHGKTRTEKARASHDYAAYRQGQKDAHTLPITTQPRISA